MKAAAVVHACTAAICVAGDTPSLVSRCSGEGERGWGGETRCCQGTLDVDFRDSGPRMFSVGCGSQRPRGEEGIDSRSGTGGKDESSLV